MNIACRKHPQVVGFMGANVDYPGSPMLVFERMSGGSLAEMLEVHAACGFRPPRAAWLCWSARRPRAQTASNAAATVRRVTSLCSPPDTLPGASSLRRRCTFCTTARTPSSTATSPRATSSSQPTARR